MKVYTFIFSVGFLNLVLPFVGVPTSYKNYAFIGLGIVTIGFSLVLRAIENERRINAAARQAASAPASVRAKKIEEVVEMTEEKPAIIPEAAPKRRGRKPKAKVVVREEVYE